MSPIANYNLGSVQGEVRITYDGRGVRAAREDVQAYLDEQGRWVDENGRLIGSQEQAQRAIRETGNETTNLADKVRNTGQALINLNKIPVLVSQAAQVALFAGELAPLLGLSAVAPAVFGAAAASVNTFKVATVGMGDALTAVAEGDVEALNEAMAKLSPSARAVVQEVQRQKPAWDALQLDVQEQFFTGLGDVVQRLGNTYLPVLREGLGDIAEEQSKMAASSAEALMRPQTVASLGILLQNTADTTREFGSALGDVLAGIINIAGVGSNFLPGWAEDIGGAAQAFREWTETAEGQQQINDWIEQGAEALSKLWEISSNIGGTLAAVFGASEEAGVSMIENMVNVTGAMEQWAQSEEGQRQLVAVWQLMAEVSAALYQAIGMVLTVVGHLAAWFMSLPEPIRQIVAQMTAWGLIIGFVLTAIAPLVAFFTTWGATMLMVASYAGNIIMALGRMGFAVVRFAALLAARAVMMAASWLVAMGPIGWVIAAVIALVALIIWNWDWVKAKTIEIWTGLVTWLTDIWNSITAWAMSIWNPIAAWFQSVWDTVVTTWNTVWTNMVAFLTPIWNTIVSIITVAWEVIKNIFIFVAAVLLAIFFTIWNPIWAFLQWIWGQIVTFLQATWNGIVAVATTIWNTLVSVITTVFNAIWAFLQPILATIGNAIMTAWNAIVAAAQVAWNAVSSVVMSVWNAIWGFLAPILATIGNAIATAWNAVVGVVTTAVNAVWSVISSVFNQVWGFISSIWNQVVGFISGVWGQIVSAISGGLNRAWAAIAAWGNQVRSIAGQAIGWLVDAGRNIVTGLWNGIVGMGRWLYDRIMGWVRSVVPAPILQFLGIASPSRYMRDEVGKEIPAGVAVGIEQNSKVANQAAASMASGIGNAARTAAAEELLAAMNHGMKIYEDLSFKGMSKNLGAENDALADMFYSSGYTDLRKFLNDYLAADRTAATKTAPRTGTGSTSTMTAPQAGRVGALATSTGAVSQGSTPTNAVAQASTAAATAGVTNINIGTFALSVAGNLDPTNPIAFRASIERIRDALTDLEASFA